MISFKEILKENNESPEIDDLHNLLKNHYNRYSKNQIYALKGYTNGSGDLNSYHWKHDRKNRNHEVHTEFLDAALKKHKTPTNFHVYSGLITNPHHLMKDNIFHHKAYISTSLDPKIAEDFALYNNHHTQYHIDVKKSKSLHILKLNVPKNHPGAYVDNYSSYNNQKEFILPRNTKLLHKDVSLRKVNYKKFPDHLSMKDDMPNHNNTYRLYTHHMEIIP